MGNTLGQLIGSLREEKGWTQREFARRCGVSATQIQRIENNEILSPGLKLIMSMARSLNVHPMKLLLAFEGKDPHKWDADQAEILEEVAVSFLKMMPQDVVAKALKESQSSQ